MGRETTQTQKKRTSVIATRATVVRRKGAEEANGFVMFMRERGIVGLAVGLATGAAAGDTVKKLVAAFINPLVQLLIGTHDTLETASWTVVVAERKGVFEWGAFVSSLISLVATALVIYLVIHLVRLDKKKE